MRRESARPGFIRTIAVFSFAGLVLCATGCFLQPLPPDGDQAFDGDPSVGQVLGDPDEFAPENPVRTIGDPEDIPPDDGVDIPIEEFGDLNEDGLIDDTDVELFTTQFGSASDDALASAADLDGDGAVTLVDFQMLLSTLATGE